MTVDDGFRECHVVKKPDEEFEFFLKVDDKRKGQVITNLTNGGPAERAGVKDGDRLVKINGENVESLSHDEIVNIIRQCIPKNEIKFVLIDEAHDKPKDNGSPKVNGNASRAEVDLRPRICKITKKRGTFGFHLQVQGKGKPGHFIKEVAEGGPAHESGLRVNDRVIEVGGTNVEKLSHEKVVNAIKKSGNTAVLLVADEATYKHFAARKKKIKKKHAYSTSQNGTAHSRTTSSTSNTKSSVKSVSMSTTTNKDEVARIIHVVRGKQGGYGFFLRVKRGHPGEYAGDLVENQASALCGLCEDDRVIAVNGDVVIGAEHAEVVKLVKSIPHHVVFVVVGPNAEKKAKTDGLAAVVIGAKESLIDKPEKIELEKKNNSYGFFLKMDKNNPTMHVVADVESDGAAEEAGLKNGQIVAMVGSHDVSHESHEECVNKIKEAGSKVTLTVASRAAMELFYKVGVELTEEFINSWPSESCLRMPDFGEAVLEALKEAVVEKAAEEAVQEAVKDAVEEVAEEHRKLRLCKLTKTSGGFGFFLRDDNGHFLTRVEAGGPAAKAGARENDEIIEINGVNVEKETHDEVVKKIRNSGDSVTFLVMDEEDKKYMKAKGLIIAAGVLVAASEAKDEARPLPRVCVLEKDSGGYGFHLNGEGGDRPGQYLRRLQAGGVAEKAGVKEGDRLIEINGTNISDKNHDELVQMIRASGNKVTFLVVDEQADLYYKSKGVQIIAALAVADAIADVKDAMERKSTSSSLVEAEATVHEAPDDKQDEDAPRLNFPPPPEKEDEGEERREMFDVDPAEEALKEELKEEIKDELREEIAEELREEAAEEVREAVAEAVVEAAKDEAFDELQEEVQESIEDAVKDEIRENLEEAVEERIEDAVEDAIQERIEDAVEEKIEDAVEDKIEDAVQERIEDAIEEHVEDAVEERIQDAVEERIEDAVEERVEDVIEERIQDAVEEKIEDAIEERIADAVEERIEDAIEERIQSAVEEKIEDAVEERIQDAVEERIEDAVEEKIQEAAEERIKEAVVEEIQEQLDENAIPLRAVAGAAAAAALRRSQDNSPKREEPKTPPATPVEAAPARPSVKQIAAANRFISNQSSAPRNDIPRVRIGSANKDFAGRMAMFETGGSQPNEKPSWAKKSQPAPAAKVEEKKAEAVPKPKAKPFTFTGGSNMFKIVESSPVFD